jgi:predicted O-methyltransferase YrrM
MVWHALAFRRREAVRPIAHYALWLLGLTQPTTQTTNAERACLARHAAGRRRLVEIGVWHGVTTARLRSVMASNGLLLAVDPYPIGRLGFSLQQRIARSVVRRVRNGRVEWLRMTGTAAADRFAANGAGLADFVFIDGDHSYEGLRGDWEAWSSLVAPGGIVALHDSHPTPERPIHDAGSVRYTRDVVSRDRRFERINVVDSLTIMRRHAEARTANCYPNDHVDKHEG